MGFHSMYRRAFRCCNVDRMHFATLSDIRFSTATLPAQPLILAPAYKAVSESKLCYSWPAYMAYMRESSPCAAQQVLGWGGGRRKSTIKYNSRAVLLVPHDEMAHSSSCLLGSA